MAVVEPSTGLSNGLRKPVGESENAEAESETGTVESKPMVFVMKILFARCLKNPGQMENVFWM